MRPRPPTRPPPVNAGSGEDQLGWPPRVPLMGGLRSTCQEFVRASLMQKTG